MKSYGAAEKLAEQAAGKEEPKAAAAADKIEEDGMYLFTTSTCPNCKMAKEMLAEEQYEELAPLTVTPEPDSVVRVHMVSLPLDEPIEIPEQELTPMERTGFTVVEWGGTDASYMKR